MNSTVKIIQGHVMPVLRTLPDNSVHLVCTSPPYLGLRSYNTDPQVWGGEPGHDHEWGQELRLRVHLRGDAGDKITLTGGVHKGRLKEAVQGQFCQKCGAWLGELGGEPSVELYVSHIVEIMREVRRVLHPSGLVFFNIADCYGHGTSAIRQQSNNPGVGANRPEAQNSVGRHGGAAKQLLGVPWRCAFALQEDSWILRSDIIWAKGLSFCPTHAGNVMPESVRDRCTRSHEYVFMFSKKARYFFDGDAVKENYVAGTAEHLAQPGLDSQPGGGKVQQYQANFPGKRKRDRRPVDILKAMRDNGQSGRNLRDVWAISEPGYQLRADLTPEERAHVLREFCEPVEPSGDSPLLDTWALNAGSYKGAHFATYPQDLVSPMIKAGTSEAGCCPLCLEPWVRVVERKSHYTKREATHTPRHVPDKVDSSGWEPPTITDKGWRQNCRCPAQPPQPCTVFDPFTGSGTTAVAAVKLGRNFIGAELNQEYVELAHRRIDNIEPLFTLSEVDSVVEEDKYSPQLQLL